MRGIDIYHGNPLSNTYIKKAFDESDFVIIKATQGTSYKYTDYFKETMKKAKQAGKLLGAYHYASGNDAVKEADYFLSIIKDYIGTAILCLDWESIQNKAWGSTTWCTKFINRVKEKTGVTCFLYTGYDGIKQNKSLANKVPLWFAGYPKPSYGGWAIPNFKYNVAPWNKYTIWQYTSSSERCDRNTTSMTKAQWQNYAKKEVKKSVKKTASALLSQAKSWIGCKESDGTHKKIIDTYNAHTPLARGYKVKYTDSWCATFVSACAIKTGMTDLIPTECSCNQMITLMKKKGIWHENENITPKAGYIVFYDWQDDGKGDNQGSSDHVGIVESVSEGVITIIEGNYQDSVKRRKISVNGRYLRGYGIPKYDAEEKKGYSGVFPKTPTSKPTYFTKGDGYKQRKELDGEIVKMQKFLNWYYGKQVLDYSGKYGDGCIEVVKKFQKAMGIPVNGHWGNKCLEKAKKIKR